MYVPRQFAESDPERVRRSVDAWPFATLFTAGTLGPFASHVPLLRDGDRLVGHLARANPQVGELGGTVLCVFHGPHAMIRSDWYASPAVQVPTWNYAAVHATGTARVLEDPLPVIDRLMQRFQPTERIPSGEGERDRFVAGLARAIVAFEVRVERWEGKVKLSQNRDPEDRRRVREALRARGDPDDLAVAAWMDELEGSRGS